MNSGALGNRKWRLRICAMSYNWRTKTLDRGMLSESQTSLSNRKPTALRWDDNDDMGIHTSIFNHDGIFHINIFIFYISIITYP